MENNKKHFSIILLLVLVLVLVLALALSCKTIDPVQYQFENSLPAEDLSVLNQMLRSFDQLLANKYEGNIISFLKDVGGEISILPIENAEQGCQLIAAFDKSTLEYKSEKLKYDTVFASNNFKIGQEELISKDSFIITIDQAGDTSWMHEIYIGDPSIEVQVDKVKEEGYWNFISESSFVRALIAANIDNKGTQD